MKPVLRLILLTLAAFLGSLFASPEAEAFGWKTAPGDFFCGTLEDAGENDPSAREQCRINGWLNYDTTSGCTVAARTTTGQQGGLNLFRAGPAGTSTREAATAWRPGDRMLNLPNQGSPRANWQQNSGHLRQEMRRNEPIFDSFRNPNTGQQIPAGVNPTDGGRFLNAERHLLETRGWRYNPSTGAYHPPGG